MASWSGFLPLDNYRAYGMTLFFFGHIAATRTQQEYGEIKCAKFGTK